MFDGAKVISRKAKSVRINHLKAISTTIGIILATQLRNSVRHVVQIW